MTRPPAVPDPDPEALLAAVEALGRRSLVVVPTDTGYGLAADALDPTAVERVFEAQRRPRAQALAVAVADVAMMEQVARVGPLARALAERFLPGPLTLVLPPDPGVPDELRGDGPGLGVRIPGHPWALELCRRFGPLAVTSASLHGQHDPATCAAARAQLGAGAQVYLDAGTLPGQASTILDLTTRAPRILREGALSAAELQPWLATSPTST